MRRGTEGPETDRGRTGYRIPAERLPDGYLATLESRAAKPVAARPAATVVLLRQGADGPEALLLRRNRATGFVPGAYVFPGGRVDAADADEALIACWDGLTAEGAAARLGLPLDADPPAIAYYGAALREAVEETGLLAGGVAAVEPPDGGRSLASVAVARQRERLLEGESTFAAALGTLDVRLDGSGIEYIAHWITPAIEPRRYDTRFFAAKVPAGSRALHDPREMTDSLWLTPRAALNLHRDGRLPMIFPTIRTLEDLAGFVTVDELLAHYRDRTIAPVQPEIVRTDGGVELRVGGS